MSEQITIEADNGEREEMERWLAEHEDFDIHAKFMGELKAAAVQNPVEFQKMVDDCAQAMDEEFPREDASLDAMDDEWMIGLEAEGELWASQWD